MKNTHNLLVTVESNIEETTTVTRSSNYKIFHIRQVELDTDLF